jgi:uncharacterized protein YjbI with pentapeptide repeats
MLAEDPIRLDVEGAGRIRVSFVLTFVVLTIATFPGEWLDARLHNVRLIHAVRQTLVEGDIDFAARKPKSLWSNVLVLPDLDVAGRDPTSTAARETTSFRARDLKGAVLIDATLRKVDFIAADLSGARLDRADLRGAKFDCSTDADGNVQVDRCAQLQGASLILAQLQGASLDRARMKKVSLLAARLQGASLKVAQLQGADLDGAELQGASLDDAWLPGASLDQARLQDASLVRAHLQGASLKQTRLQGADLGEAELQGATLNGAHLQGATLNGAHLRGASLILAQLQGASLDGAHLQGALLKDAQLQGASLVHVFVWRADARGAHARGARVENPETRPKQGCNVHLHLPCLDWTADQLDGLKKRITAEVPSEKLKETLARLDPVLDPAKPLPNEEDMAALWKQLQNDTPSEDDYEAEGARQLQQIGCAPDDAPYVLTGLVRSLGQGFRLNSSHVSMLASEFLKPDCRGALGLSDADRAKLEQLAARRP